MSYEVLPIDGGIPNYSVNVILSDVEYVFTLLWNERGQFWTMGIYLTDDTLLATMKIVSDWSLTRVHTNELLPPGKILCINTSDDGTEPDFYSLGNKHLIVYELL